MLRRRGASCEVIDWVSFVVDITIIGLPWLVTAKASFLCTFADLKLGKADDCEVEEIAAGAPLNSSTILFCVYSANSFDLEGRS